jgi:hypothetical protein
MLSPIGVYMNINIATRLKRPLTADEKFALSRYGADSTFLHVVAQGREQDLHRDPLWQEFWPKCRAIMQALDGAIAASELVEEGVLYSAFGNGLAVRGSLLGSPEAFIGLTYCYAGYISTSSQASFRDRFLEPRRTSKSRPTILEFRLPAGFAAIDMHHGGHAGEFEFLLGRDTPFEIMQASIVDDDVLSLVLAPQ